MKRLVTLTATSALSMLTLLPGVASAASQTSPSPTSPSQTSPSQSGTPQPAALSSPAAVPPVIIFNQKPVFNDYLACVGGYVYTDFVDPDGNDALMAVQMAVYRPSVGHWTYHAMTNSGPSVHGVFFWTELADHGINPVTVTSYAFRATDQAGLKSSWVYADSACNLE
jgi:hypothetical protein